MKPLIYIISKDYNGEIAMSEEEFKKILNEVYDAGYEDGKAQATRIYPSTPPIEPTPYTTFRSSVLGLDKEAA